MDVVAVNVGSDQRRRRRKGSSGHVVAPLPTPRRSCCGRASAPRARAVQVGELAERSQERGRGNEREAPLPPPPGRCGEGGGAHRARACRHGSSKPATPPTRAAPSPTRWAGSRISSSDRLA
ncbi:unnamed protein product [Urochloa humidicola]